MFFANEITRIYYSAHILSSYEDFAEEYIGNYNAAKVFLADERQKDEHSEITFDGYAPDKTFLSEMPKKLMDGFVVTIVNTYYFSHKNCNFNDFASWYLNNYSVVKQMLRNAIRAEEKLYNSFEIDKCCDTIRLLTAEAVEDLAIQIVNSYYVSMCVGKINDFTEDYLERYKFSSSLAINVSEAKAAFR